MDVTYYKTNSEQDKIYYGRLSIIRDFVIANADEYGYKYLGVNSCYPLVELIYKDDRTVFLYAVNRLGEGPQSVIVRLKHCSGSYRCLCMTIEYNGHIVSGFKSFDITYTDVMTIHENYEKYLFAVRKYRKILSIIPQIYFEYTLNDDKFVAYTYHNDKSIDIFKGKLKELTDGIYETGTLSESAFAAFEKFRDNLTSGGDQFEENMPAEIFGEQYAGKIFDIKSTVLYRNDVKDMVVGVMTSSDKIDPEKYYLSEAAKDVGTGLLNKRAISEYAVDRINNYGKGFYLLIMDIDDFKTINDTYGHMFGDEVLTKSAEILKSVLSGRGAVGRFGGDEFLMIIENVGSEEELRRVLKTISKHIQWAFTGTGKHVSITTSSGISKFPEDGDNYEDLFRKADKSLYIAKAKGKNRFIIYDENKHGSVDVDDSNRNVGLNLAIDREQRIGAISDIIIKLNSEGIVGITQSLKLIQRYFDVDGIAVYSGEGLRRTFAVGKYIAPVEKFDFFECAEYRRYFNDNGVYAETNILKLKSSCPKVYEAYVRQETAEFIQCSVTDGTEAEVIVSFDVFNRKRKWSVFETDFLTIIGKLICDIVIRSEQN